MKHTSLTRYLGHTLQSNIVMSYAVQTKKHDYADDLHTVDTDSYQFVVDTGTTFHVCKHRELFFGEISKARHIYIKGVGRRIKVRGYGKIKLGVVNNNNKECELAIHNVLYVPDCPTNLLSPQLWSQSTNNPAGTGEITVDNTTLLFWDNHSHTKCITNHPYLKLSIFHANRGRTISKLVKEITYPEPEIPSCLNTSIPMLEQKDGNEITHIIPMDDEDSTQFRSIQPEPIMVDELDKAHKQRGVQHQPNQWDRCPIDNVNNNNGEVLVDDDTSITSIQSDTLSDYLDHDDNSIDSRPSVIPTNLDDMAQRLAQGMDKEQKLWMRYHYNLKHLPNAHMCKLAEAGIIP